MVNSGFNQECIQAHNRYRRMHGCPPLSYDPALAHSAQKYAEHLVRIKRMVHSSAKDYGENLAWRYSSGVVDMTGEEATKMWYDEIEIYRFSSPKFSKATGHFTQVVWKNTTHAGFGIAFSPDGHDVYVVGQYKPPGNWEGEFEQNVPRPVNAYPSGEGKDEANVTRKRRKRRHRRRHHKCVIM